jgi:membrane protein implicated in regulation of membrane protease activity
MDSPETWRWIWLIAAVLFAAGEIVTTGFFLLPFAIGAGVAAVLGFADVDVGIQWVSFLATSTVVFLAMRPLAKRLNDSLPAEGIGSRRLIGQMATVLQGIPAGVGGVGLIRVDREEWRAESAAAEEIPEGIPVRIADVRGTHAIVETVERSPS